MRPYVIRWLGTAVGYAWSILSLLVFLPVAWAALPFDRRQRLHDSLSILWARGILWFAGTRVQVKGAENIPPAERFVVVGNHQSLLDTMAVVSALQPRTPIRMVAKRSLFKVPVLGWAMRAFGHMPVDHKSMRASMAGLQQAQSMVAQRASTVFFAEGTRSPDGRLLPFHSAAFHIAARAGVRVLPLSISGSYRVLPKRHLVVQSNGPIDVQIHPPLSIGGASPEQVHAAAEACRKLIEAALPEAYRASPSTPPPAGSPPPSAP
jgi:1-acyl-sn-glycerol-3-phosphate acyltransferase